MEVPIGSDKLTRNSTFDLPASPQPFFRPYVVGFFDILGHGDKLNGLRVLPSDKATEAEYLKCVKRTIGTVRGFRQLFRETFEAFRDAPVDPPRGIAVPSELLTVVKDLRNLDLRFQGFGDTVMIFFPTFCEKRGFDAIAAQWLLSTIASITPGLLSIGVPVRGAVEVGIGVEFFDRELHGPVVADVYRMESKEAEYPRILIGDELWAFLKSVANQPGNDLLTLLSKHEANDCMSQIVRDDDGRLVLNYLNEYFRTLNSKRPSQFDAFVRQSLEFAMQERKKFQSQGNDILAGRYERLIRFIQQYGTASLESGMDS